MKNIYALILLPSIFLIGEIKAQVTTDQALIALEELLNAREVKAMQNQLVMDIQDVSQLPVFTPNDYEHLSTAYSDMSRIYNRLYLAEIKLDLTSFRQLKRLGKNPEKQSKRYSDQYKMVMHHYEQKIMPVLEDIIERSQSISADFDGNELDSLQLVQERLRTRQAEMSNSYQRLSNFTSSFSLVSSAFSLVSNISRMISEKKMRNQRMVEDFVNRANGLFSSMQMLEWESLGIIVPPEAMEQEIQIESRGFDGNDVESPPTDMAFLSNVSGDVYLEVYDEGYDEDIFMPIEEGPSMDVVVNDHGSSDASFDLKIGRKKGKRSSSSSSSQVTRSVAPINTMEAYPSGTLYRLRSSGNGYVYVFSINSGNRMYGIFPHQGETEELPSGTGYSYPDNAYFEDEESGRVTVSIPDGEYYIEISDAPGSSIPIQETMIVLVSRSLIDFRQTLEYMERMDGDLSPQERLAQIFGTMMASPQQANVYINDGVINYSLSENDPAVVPIVFGIKRR